MLTSVSKPTGITDIVKAARAFQYELKRNDLLVLMYQHGQVWLSPKGRPHFDVWLVKNKIKLKNSKNRWGAVCQAVEEYCKTKHNIQVKVDTFAGVLRHLEDKRVPTTGVISYINGYDERALGLKDPLGAGWTAIKDRDTKDYSGHRIVAQSTPYPDPTFDLPPEMTKALRDYIVGARAFRNPNGTFNGRFDKLAAGKIISAMKALQVDYNKSI